MRLQICKAHGERRGGGRDENGIERNCVSSASKRVVNDPVGSDNTSRGRGRDLAEFSILPSHQQVVRDHQWMLLVARRRQPSLSISISIIQMTPFCTGSSSPYNLHVQVLQRLIPQLQKNKYLIKIRQRRKAYLRHYRCYRRSVLVGECFPIGYSKAAAFQLHNRGEKTDMMIIVMSRITNFVLHALYYANVSGLSQ